VKRCCFLGWGVNGRTRGGAQKLQEGSVHIVTRESCQSYYPNHVITDRMVCAGNAGTVDACSVSSYWVLLILDTANEALVATSEQVLYQWAMALLFALVLYLKHRCTTQDFFIVEHTEKTNRFIVVINCSIIKPGQVFAVSSAIAH